MVQRPLSFGDISPGSLDPLFHFQYMPFDSEDEFHGFVPYKKYKQNAQFSGMCVCSGMSQSSAVVALSLQSLLLFFIALERYEASCSDTIHWGSSTGTSRALLTDTSRGNDCHGFLHRYTYQTIEKYCADSPKYICGLVSGCPYGQHSCAPQVTCFRPEEPLTKLLYGQGGMLLGIKHSLDIYGMGVLSAFPFQCKPVASSFGCLRSS